MGKICAWCEKDIHGYYLIYKGKTFCRCRNDLCLKNYLFDEADSEIVEDRECDDDYRMDMVTFMEERGLD